MRLVRTALLVPWLALAAATNAAPAAAADPALEEAKTLTGKASIEYDVGHFEQALELYTSAYQGHAAASCSSAICSVARASSKWRRGPSRESS